ncbi:hypothetical protein [Vibrio nigripulchritudo]|uniref:hypothetical protein n=1 Tax=Vibrio nigripulchritudo TaxID=28173 RepID=UPI00056E0388|nr:hypothetical protein [Vibrio nigripulchritudo]
MIILVLRQLFLDTPGSISTFAAAKTPSWHWYHALGDLPHTGWSCSGANKNHFEKLGHTDTIEMQQ